MAKDKKDYVAPSFQEMGGVTGAMDAIGSVAGSIAKVGSNLKDIKGMDNKGNLTGKKDVLGNTMAGAKAGADIGKFIPIPGGELIGAGVGAVAALGATVLTKPPSFQDQLSKRNSFDLGVSMEAVRAEDTFAQQQQMAEKGLRVNGSKTIEVERDEIVLRKNGKSYTKVADFKGGKNHVDNGEQYTAADGDVIIPGNKRNLALKHLRLRDTRALNTMISKLPVDNGQKEFANGTKGVNGSKDDKRKARWDKFLAQPGVKDKVVAIARKHGFTPERLMAVMDYETAGTLNPSQKSIGNLSSATGLIQFIEESAKALGTTTKDLAKMGTITQLDYVKKYYDKFHKYGDDPYDSVIASGSKNLKDNHILYPKGSKKANKNPSWQDKNGNITKTSARKAARNFDDYDGFSDIDNTGDTKKSSGIPQKGVGTYEQYLETTKANNLIPKSREWYKANVTDPSNKGNAAAFKKNQEEIAFDKRMREDTKFRGMYHVNDPEGLMVKANKQMIGATTGALGGGLIEKYFSPGARAYNLFQDVKGGITGKDTSKDKINIQEVGFTDPKLSKQLDDFVTYLQHDADVTWFPADVMRTVTTLQQKILAGQDVSGSIPNVISEIISGSTPEEFQALMDDAEKKGVLNRKTKWIINNIGAEPENYWTSQMKGNLGFDIATLVANPKGIINMVKGAGKLLKGATSIANLKKLMTAAKKLPGATAKVFKALKPEIEAATLYKEGESMEDLIALGRTLDGAGVPMDPALAKVSGSNTWSKAISDTWKKVSAMPDAVRKNLVGKSYTEINATHKELQQITGKSSSELLSMSKAEVGKLIATKTDDATAAVEAAIKAKEEAILGQKAAKVNVTTARKELAELRKIRGPKANEAKLEAALAKAEKEFEKSTEVLTKAYSEDELYKKNWEQIGKLEAFESDPLYKDKFRTLVKLEAGIARHLDNLDDLGDTPEALKKAITTHRSWADKVSVGIAKVDNVKDAAGNVIKGEGNLITAINNATDARDAVKVAGKGEAAALKAGIVTEAQLAKVPGLMEIVSKDAAILKQIRSGLLTTGQIANILRERKGDPIEIKKLEEMTAPDTVQNADDDGSSATRNRPKVTNIETTPAGISPMDSSLKDEGIVETKKAAIKARPNRPSIGAVATEALGALAEYAPAFYNLAKGMQKPDKVKREFVSPQTKEYKNMSQQQLNFIDDAFNTATGNARNASGGMMSNFRSNIEKSWADKIKRTGEVNTMEAQRADQVASENINIRNQADQTNTQLASQYNQIDMQSKAATGQFLAQGMQDIANISGVHRQDRAQKANQDLMLKMIGQGRNYDPLTGEFIGGSTATKATTEPQQKVTPTTPFVAPTMKSVAEINAIGNESINMIQRQRAEDLKKKQSAYVIPSFDFEGTTQL